MKKLLLALLLVSGCNSIDSDMRSWIGSPVSELINAWGEPSARYNRPDGGNTFTWNETKYTGNGNIRNFCNREFVTDPAGKIISYSYSGCKRYAPD